MSKDPNIVIPGVVKLDGEISAGSDVANAQPFRPVPARETIPTYCTSDVRKLQVATKCISQ